MSLKKIFGSRCSLTLSKSVKYIGVVSLVSASIFLFGGYAHGQLTYTDQATFLSASGATAEAAMPSSGSTTSQVVGGMTFTNGPSSSLSWGFVDAP